MQINGYAIQNTFNIKDVDGTVIQAGDVSFMASLDNEPAVDDKIEFGGKEYNIVSVNPFNPSGNCVIYYTIQGR